MHVEGALSVCFPYPFRRSRWVLLEHKRGRYWEEGRKEGRSARRLRGISNSHFGERETCRMYEEEEEERRGEGTRDLNCKIKKDVTILGPFR